MFDKLVVSSLERPKRTATKYFLGTGALYISLFVCAFVTSVLMSDPNLADTGRVLTLVSPSLPPMLGTPRVTRVPRQQASASGRSDLYHVQNLETILRHDPGPPPTLRPLDYRDDGGVGVPVGPQGFGGNAGVIGGIRTDEEPAPRPDPPRAAPIAQTRLVENRTLRIPSSILQGSAIERRKPMYPPLAQQIRLQGDVSVEVMIAPDGRVESARIVSGHPMLADKAREAALGWRFQPTLLNGVAVRVTGVIVFVFKLNQ